MILFAILSPHIYLLHTTAVAAVRVVFTLKTIPISRLLQYDKMSCVIFIHAAVCIIHAIQRVRWCVCVRIHSTQPGQLINGHK